MAIKYADFCSIFINDAAEYYNDFVSNQEIINSWVAENFNEIGSIGSCTEVVPPKKIIKEIVKNGYRHKEQHCHYSAKAACILNEKIEYITGFVVRTNSSLITHSFNLYENKIIDFARIDNEFNPIIENRFTFPQIYYGIKIPRKFILQYKDAVMKNDSMNPLLFEWYLENNSI